MALSQSEILYFKGMNMSESEYDDGDEWDDKKLNDAYDKALRIANAEVAKRVAMATNTSEKQASSKNKKANKEVGKQGSNKKKTEHQWKSGMPCRAMYEEDGMEYEAFVLRIINERECVVRFLGYENSEIVEICTLKPTLGNDERTRQIEQALLEKEDNYNSETPTNDGMECSDRMPSPASVDTSSQRRKKQSKKKKNSTKNVNGFELPDITAMHMPNISMMRNLGSMDMPMPPPPMAFTDRSDAEDQTLSSMLLSWYMSGYYTGLYQGMKRGKESRRHV